MQHAAAASIRARTGRGQALAEAGFGDGTRLVHTSHTFTRLGVTTRAELAAHAIAGNLATAGRSG